MSKWDDIADDAAESTDKELEAGLAKLVNKDLAGLFPDPVDKAQVDNLIAKVNAASSYNERAAAFKEGIVKLSAGAAKMVKGAMVALAFMFLAGGVQAQTVIDLNAPLADARIGLAWDFDGEQLGIAYVPMVYWVGSEGQEYATLNLGATDKLSNGDAGYLVSAGPRIDTLFKKLAGTKFAENNLRFAVLPPLQINFNLVTSDFKRFTPHFSICTRFGGK